MTLPIIDSTPRESCWWPRYTGPRCAVKDCEARLSPGPDGILTGCEHAGARNLTLAELLESRKAPRVATVVTPHPAPEVPGRDAEPSEIPRAVALVLRKVVEPWQVRTTYSRGTTLSRSAVVDSVVVRFAHPDGRTGWAGWSSGKFDAAFVNHIGWTSQVNATELKRMLADPTSVNRVAQS